MFVHATAELKHAQRLSAPMLSVDALQSPALLLPVADKQGCSFPSLSDVSCCELSSAGYSCSVTSRSCAMLFAAKCACMVADTNLFAVSQQAASLPGLPS